MLNQKESNQLINKMCTQYATEHIPLLPKEFRSDFLPYSNSLFLPSITGASMISMTESDKKKLFLAYDLHQALQLKFSVEEGKYNIEPNIFKIVRFGMKAPPAGEEKLLGFIKNVKLLETEAKTAFTFIKSKRSVESAGAWIFCGWFKLE